MRLGPTCAMALSSLGTHPFRSLLAGLGVVFGVGAVIAMLAIGEGARQESLKQINALGTDKIIIRSVVPPGKGMMDNAFYGLTRGDLSHIANTFENISLAVPLRKTNQPLYVNGEKSDIKVVGVTMDFMHMTHSRLAGGRGRGFTDLDLKNGLPICLVGKDASKKLFRMEDPLLGSVQVRHQRFQVAGVIDNPQGFAFSDGYAINNCVFLPFNIANQIFGEITPGQPGKEGSDTCVEIDLLVLQILDVEQIDNTARRLRSYLRATHPGGDYEIEIPLMLLKQKERTQRIFSIVMGSIAGISLLVGGIGIMNIMLANVYERMREIGTRLALGAKRRDILLQFLLESVFLSGIGGLVGLGSGVGLADCIENYAGMPVRFTVTAALVSVGVSVLTGVVFGTAPAWKAARLNPIEALRAE